MPVRVYVMDPDCASQRDRYRIEPSAASMEDPERYTREILRPLYEATKDLPDFGIYLYNFPVSFAIEEVDDVCRVMFYGHGKRGTDGPILTFGEGTDYHAYFADQIRWLERLAAPEGTPEPWKSKGIQVHPYQGQ